VRDVWGVGRCGEMMPCWMRRGLRGRGGWAQSFQLQCAKLLVRGQWPELPRERLLSWPGSGVGGQRSGLRRRTGGRVVRARAVLYWGEGLAAFAERCRYCRCQWTLRGLVEGTPSGWWRGALSCRRPYGCPAGACLKSTFGHALTARLEVARKSLKQNRVRRTTPPNALTRRRMP